MKNIRKYCVICLSVLVLSLLVCVIVLNLVSTGQDANGGGERTNDGQTIRTGMESENRSGKVGKEMYALRAALGAAYNKEKEEEYIGEPKGGRIDELYARRNELKEQVAPFAWEYTPVILEEMMAEEEKDLSWTMEMEREAAEYLKKENTVGTKVIEVDCRESLCKTVQLHTGNDELEFFRDEVAPFGPWAGGELHGTSEVLEDGRVRSRVYFTRPGMAEPFNEIGERIAEITKDM